MYKIDIGNNLETALVHFFEGKKFIGKDMARMNAMVAAAKEKGHLDEDSTNVYLVLSETSGICKRNTLPKLLDDGVIVQRVA